MSVATLNIDLDAIGKNWTQLNSLSAENVETAAVVKADGYGLDVTRVAKTLAKSGVKTFFVAAAEEGIELRKAIGPKARIFVFSGHMAGDGKILQTHNLIPLLNSSEQVARHFTDMSGHKFGIQLDTGMNRLGMEPAEFTALRDQIVAMAPELIISHLACADEPNHPQNAAQLAQFRELTDGLPVKRSLAATGGILLGPEYHFDLCRPGVGLYGGLPFEDAEPVVTLSIPTVQFRVVEQGETVGYSATWKAKTPTRVATVMAGYADGLIRSMGSKALVWAGDIPCPLIGRVSMDLLTVDVSHLENVPDHFDILGPYQGIDQLADATGTIGYEILTSLGARYNRVYTDG